MTKRPLGRLLQQTVGSREPTLSYTNTPTNIGGIMMSTPMKDTRESGVSGLLRETHKRENIINNESVEQPMYVPYEPTGGKRQEVNKGKQNKKRKKRKKKQPKKNYRNKK